MKVRLGVDMLGGDHDPLVVWEALGEVLLSSTGEQPVEFTVFATSDVHHQLMNSPLSRSVRIVTAEDFVSMEDSLLAAVRKKRSSMALGLDALQQGDLDGFVSSGNTAALVTLARSKIPMIPAVPRPALLVSVPTLSGFAVILDVGATVSVNPDEMVGFARMGLAYRQSLSSNSNQPFTLGLLNIGSEERKGTDSHKQTFRMLRNIFGSAFLGNIESGDVFSGKVDIVVTDGFTGNVFLKTAEGLFDFLRHILGDRLEKSIKMQFDYTIYPGSIISGLSRLVIKCHGKSHGTALFGGISGAIDLARANVCSRIADRFGDNVV
ncbi:phosphate acyltransferase PlsX [Chlamydia trachomatis]|uniref:phosphate acyltransferase PlsX n=1 Tax=Chlamydia trachomatis TaxID=813 RepID=UPI0001B5A4A3|nr:phosphate acyltransferase PlsX [Chlamydia trachomatis]AGT64776.1 glycerol-3-phosphate acyltransferase [Chlamydia trachomatis]AGT65706.1 glycerol-3-phosphate acyltransferase [Chlamydia trachomatis]AGT66632.1 glycerol-3-phosphate acyltransferase [Chlamydia trachomatis]AGT67561.1 glycerol-3-phosphate acyltransferase [Chlamydia trachomatis F/11-96]AGT68483.1 glycerol-3-phosphate acyltransferase [Chlamydia trachomatis]